MNKSLSPMPENSLMPPLSELEIALQGPDAEVTRDAALQRIDALEVRLRKAMAIGVQSKDYLALTAMLDACSAAKEVLLRTVLTNSTGAR